MDRAAPSARDELFAFAAWRRVLSDRGAGVTATPEDYAALFPSARDAVLAELRGAGTPHEGVLGHYRLLREVARGGQAVVWLAEDLALHGRRVALKVVTLRGRASPAVALRLRREVELAARLEVDGVCPIYDAGNAGDVAWIAMRWVDGATLAQVLARAPGPPAPATLRERVALVERAARIVHAVHGQGVVHRDLKPSNIMVTPAGDPVVLDFGIARLLEDDPLALTATGLPLGTPAYMAPEQVHGHEGVDARADVWALGAILFECVTGQRPFHAPTPFLTQRAILEAAAPDARQLHRAVPRDLSVVIATALARELPHRYRTALDLAEDLRAVRECRTVLAKPASVATRLLRFARRSPVVFGLLLALFATVSAALGVALFLLRRADAEVARADRAQVAVERLTDLSRVRALVRELEEELAIDSRQLSKFAAWHVRADEVIKRLDEHRAALAALRREGNPVPASDPREAAARRARESKRLYLEETLIAHRERLTAAQGRNNPAETESARTALAAAEDLVARARARQHHPVHYEFADADAQVVHDATAELVAAIEALAEPRPGLSTALAERVLWRAADVVRKNSIDAHAEAWQAAIGRIGEASGRYRGLTITPQEGLVPLGPDPASGLEEFAHVSTGPLPQRDSSSGLLTGGDDAALVLVLVPGGEVRIGVLDGQPTPRVPPATVRLAPFFIGKHEVTQAQYLRIMWDLPSLQVAPWPTSPRHPVEHLQATQGELFARRLRLELPSEAQWEYACRAGTDTDWSCDHAALTTHANLGGEGRLQGAPPQHGTLAGPASVLARHHPVGQLLPNAFGLHDMHGNVREWTFDTVGDYGAIVDDGTGRRAPGALKSRVVRGGSFLTSANRARSWWREDEPPHHVLADVGIRVARGIDP
jgi:formylglycine-generating enzyme required for sulfatase activity